MRLRVYLLTVLIAGVPLAAQSHPDLQGFWNSATATPLERPAQFKNKEFLTPKEAADLERRAEAQQQEPTLNSARGFVTYNALFRESGTKVVRSLRTSIVTDPPDGRIPALKPEAAAAKRLRDERLKNPNGVKDFGLQDRCIDFKMGPPPMLPYAYNSNYQIVETNDKVLINVEMPHDNRVIHLDRQTHLPAGMQLWLGDSIGRWDGATLVVDTANFHEGGGYYGDAGGMYAWDRNLHVVERFSMQDADTILYRFEVEDSIILTRGWKGEYTISRIAGPVFEYACQEGNYALPNLLNIFKTGKQ
jgi:hypothetical protein